MVNPDSPKINPLAYYTLLVAGRVLQGFSLLLGSVNVSIGINNALDSSGPALAYIIVGVIDLAIIFYIEGMVKDAKDRRRKNEEKQ